MFGSLFGWLSTSKKLAPTAKRSRRFELLEPRLALSGSSWQVMANSAGAAAGPTVTLEPTAEAAGYAVAPHTSYGVSTTPVGSAPSVLGSTTTSAVTATNGANAAKSSTAQAAAFAGIKNPTLSSLTQSLDSRDGSITCADMLQILRTAETLNGGVISKGVMTDLKTLLSDASSLKMPGYVQVLAGDVIDGNPANAHYHGRALGNLAVGSSGVKLDDLIDKWFLGSDLPSTGGYKYSTVTLSGSIFVPTPSYLDEDQGNLGDCYLIASLGAIADTAPAAIQNMIVDNGVDAQTGMHTWTVRFYDNGKADYVTVNNQLPVSGGLLIFEGDGYGTNNPPGLWIALIEKAYAEWNETGREGRNGTNSYAGLEDGWMSVVDAQVLGHKASTYGLSSSTDLQALISGMTNKEAVTISTDDSNNSDDSLSYGLYGSHCYTVIGYSYNATNPSKSTFTLYNPWGTNQPTQPLTWTQLQATCDGLAVANPAGTQSFAPLPVGSGEMSAHPRAAAVDRVFEAI